MLSEFIFLAIGAVVSLLVDRLYYKFFERRSFEKRLREIFSEAIKNDKKKSITVKEINLLLKKKVFNKKGEYIACPKCGGKIEEGVLIDSNNDEIYETIKCKNCGWGGENPLLDGKRPL
jgi:hypothetical protein